MCSWKVNQDLYISVLQPTKRGTWMRGERKRFYQPGVFGLGQGLGIEIGEIDC